MPKKNNAPAAMTAARKAEIQAAAARDLAALDAAAGAMVKAPATPPPASPVTDKMAKGMVERGLLSSNIVAHSLRSVFRDHSTAIDVADGIMREVFEDVKPRGQVEKMLAEQLALLHGQALASSLFAAEATKAEYRDRALNSASRLLSDFRKTLGALQAFREPSRPNVYAKQANIGGQQVIVNGDVMPNEQGARDAFQ